MFKNESYNEKTEVYNPIKIYVVFHETFDETNVFFSDFHVALKRLKKYAQDTETNLDEWRIRHIIEGQPFDADFN